ncbi:hypothetical protein [Hymenobacter lucidus]|uniref:Uncharacterized protein n=1 Tax=Hymenobacter lucidus TaxID=2880930 RepID=A0ABS8AXN0_9BACT|nr:hypothetical protein [Hymenobacter lucidus]MCB2410537.1 hypothetical protein [Hymenobacter lucidus]
MKTGSANNQVASPHYLMLCEVATGIVMNPDGQTRFLNFTGAMEVPYIKVDSLSRAVNLALGIIIMYPKLEVTIYDEQKKYVQSFPAVC